MHVTGQRILRAFLAPCAALWVTFSGSSVDAQDPRPAAPLPASQPAVQPAVHRYTFAIELPDTGKRIMATALADFGASLTVDTVVFDLDAAMQVEDVVFACAGGDRMTPAPFVRSLGQVRVAIPRRPAAASTEPRPDTRCIRIAYAGVPADGLIIGTDSAGRWLAFGDNFPNRARHWLATIDTPSHKARVTFEIVAPVGRTVVANGALVETRPFRDGRVVTIWREDRAIPTYDMVVAAAPLTVTDLGKTACGFAEDGGCVPQMVYTAPEQARYMPGAFARAGDIVAFFAQTIGPYPYEKLAHVQSTTRYGGMENASAIFYYDRAFRRVNGFDDDLIAHETAHQWFGNAVTEREWAHLWLSEGFATFCAALWAQHAHGDSAYASQMARHRHAVVGARVTTTRAVIDSVETDPNRLLNENSYQKGGLVLHMLRAELGDSAFFGGVRRYYAAYRHGNAMTQDLQRALEASSGRVLGWFFDQWLRRPGWAELRTSWAWDGATKRVTLRVEQDGRFGAYRLSLPVEVVDASGARQRAMVQVEARASQSLVVPGTFANAPVSVACASDQTLLAVCTAK